MRIRRLERSEHEQTRGLYEQVFAEDSKEFVDYYYTWKTKDSIIYVAEDETGFHAMVHLNPFLVSVAGRLQKLHYIVAVATQKEYRHQGLMRRLLKLAEQEMAQRGETFTFLMPASEKIYLPFGYRFFAWQRKGVLRSVIEREAVPGAVCRAVRPQEYGELAAFVNDTLGRQYDVFVFRDAAYYERLCAEQRCQDGEVMVIVQTELEGQEPGRSDEKMGRRGDRIIGTFCTAREEADSEYEMEIREIIFAEGMQTETFGALQEYINACTNGRADGHAGDGINGRANGRSRCRVAGCQAPIALERETFEPLLMGKMPGGGELAGLWDRKRIYINEVV